MSSAAPQPYSPKLRTTPTPTPQKRKEPGRNQTVRVLLFDGTGLPSPFVITGKCWWMKAEWEWEAWETTLCEDKIHGWHELLCSSIRVSLFPAPTGSSASSLDSGRGAVPRMRSLEHREPARMEPIQQPASRCSPKQSSRLKREQRAGKADRNLIACH